MKQTKILLSVFMMVLLLTACSNNTKENDVEQEVVVAKTDYEVFKETFEAARKTFNESKSYQVSEEVDFNYYVVGKSAYIKSIFVANYEIIKEPYYMKEDSRLYITNVGSMKLKTLALQNPDKNYSLYMKREDVNDRSYEHFTEAEFHEYYRNDELDITINRLPSSIIKLEEKVVNGDTIITYETSFKLKDLSSSDQKLFDNILEIFIGEGATRDHYHKTEIKQTIILNVTKQQFVEIIYDTADLLLTSYNLYCKQNNFSIRISEPDGTYQFNFKSLNDVQRDEQFIRALKY
jgi:hypothetical protein